MKAAIATIPGQNAFLSVEFKVEVSSLLVQANKRSGQFTSSFPDVFTALVLGPFAEALGVWFGCPLAT
jgi:hypothetical protein